MSTGRLAIIKLAGLSTNDYVDQCHKESRCILCCKEFNLGDDMFNHCIENHKDWVHWKLLENMTLRTNLQCTIECNQDNPLINTIKEDLKPFNPFPEREEEGEPNSIEYQDRMFQAPRCKKCHHNDPEWDVVSSPPHKGGVKLKCVYCNQISVKD